MAPGRQSIRIASHVELVYGSSMIIDGATKDRFWIVDIQIKNKETATILS